MILLDVYENVETGDVERTYEASSVAGAVLMARDLAERLKVEDCGLAIGEAGEDELFEVYPELGYGTVVVKEVGN